MPARHKTNENIEACVVTVNNEDFGVVVGIYRPPAGNVEFLMIFCLAF